MWCIYSAVNGPESEIRGGFSSTGKCTIGATWQFLIGVSGRKKHTFLKKKNLWTSLPHIFNFSQSKNFRSIKSHLWYIVPRQKTSEVCYQMWAGESLVNKHHRLQMQIFIGRLWGETYVRMDKRGIWLVQAEKDLNHSVKIWWIL